LTAMKVLLLKPEDVEWKSFLERCEHDFYHRPEYVEVEARRMAGEPRAILIEEGEYCFFLPLIFRPIIISGENLPGVEQAKDALSPYGYPCPLILDPGRPEDAGDFLCSALEAMKVEMASQKVCSAFVRLHPLLEINTDILSSYGELVENGDTIWIDLTLTESELWRQTRSRFRSQINSAKKKGALVRRDENFSWLSRFVELYDETMDHVEAEEWYHFGLDYFSELKNNLGEHLNLFLLEEQEDVLCAGLFTECSGIVQYHLSGTSPQARNKNYLKVMIDTVRWWAKERGNKTFHLGGGVGAREDSLFFFKSGFSKLRSTFYTWRIVCDEEIYQLATNYWEHLTGLPAGDKRDFFPPYRKSFQNKT